MRIPLALEQHAHDNPHMTTLELLEWWHHRLTRLDEARNVLAGVSPDELATAVSDWHAADHANRHQGWGRDLYASRRRAARVILRTRMTLEQICAYLGCDPITFAEAVTLPDHVDRWVCYEAGMERCEDPYMLRADLGIGHQAELNWRRLRPWRADEWSMLSQTEQGRVVAKLLRPMWQAGLTPTEAVGHYERNHADRIPHGGLTRRRVETLWASWKKRYGSPTSGTHKCLHCDGEYVRYSSGHRFCSDRCRASHAATGGRRCQVCGERFESQQSTRRYCGKQCKQRAYEQRADRPAAKRRARRAARPHDIAAIAADNGGGTQRSERGES